MTTSLSLTPSVRARLRHDADARETLLRQIITERLDTQPTPRSEDHLVATYFLDLRSWTLSQAAREISYHATSGTHDIPPGSLLEECTGQCLGLDAWDATERIGLLHMGYPLKMLLQPDGHVTSTDLLHTSAGAILFDIHENRDVRLVKLEMPDRVRRMFPGPAHGSEGARRITHFDSHEPAFGTILKPTAGLTSEQVGNLAGEAAACPMFLFIKEDENLYPNLPYAPVAERTRRAMTSIQRGQDQREGKGLIYAPHITGAPHEILDTVHAVLEAGATGLMFSESFTGGTVRMVREATRHLPQPPALYGHNAGIGVRTRGGIWREVIDGLARLDGIDFRQTAPVRPGTPFIYPHGQEWEASEQTLTQSLADIPPVMIARAGGLDQGNIILNLQDAARRGLTEHILFLAGSAINSIKNTSGKPDAQLGAAAMREALDIHQSGEMEDVPLADHLTVLKQLADSKQLKALRTALAQRYPTHS